jgi:hypothetical protein
MSAEASTPGPFFLAFYSRSLDPRFRRPVWFVSRSLIKKIMRATHLGPEGAAEAFTRQALAECDGDVGDLSTVQVLGIRAVLESSEFRERDKQAVVAVLEHEARHVYFGRRLRSLMDSPCEYIVWTPEEAAWFESAVAVEAWRDLARRSWR